MSETIKVKAKATIGLERLAMWKVLDETDESITYDTVKELVKRIMTASYSPSVSEAELNADNQTVDYVTESDGGELSIGVTALDSDERCLIYGETLENGTNIENKDNMSNYVCVAYMTNRSDRLVNLYKYPKVYFTPQQESSDTKKRGSLEFKTIDLKGTALSLLKDGNSRFVRYGVNPKSDEGKAIITAWFTEGDYYKPDSE